MDRIRISLVLLSLIGAFAKASEINRNEYTSYPGKVITQQSKVLKQARKIHIYLPEKYQDSTSSYPVLYVLDGQWHYTNAVAILQSLRVPDALPEMIVVGIENSEPMRRTWFGNRVETFQEYLASELIPFIDQNYRTTNERILFGWEAGAAFATYALVEKQQLFNGVIASNGGYLTDNELKQFNELTPSNEKYLYLVNSIKDIYSIRYSNQLADKLKQTQSKTLNWQYELINDETHESLPYTAMYKGLRYYYRGFPTLAFSSIDEYEQLGGMKYLKSYFMKRGQRFGFEPEIDNATKNNLIWLAWNRDNYEYFEKFMEVFKDVLSTKRYDSAYWQNRFGRFYLKHQNFSKAKLYFSEAITKYPENALLHQGLGKVYLANGELELAKSNFAKAVKIAEKNSDPKLKEFEKDLLTLTNQ
ncbi:esterase [Thalassotalea sp. M1531]|uniref:Esterase n=1 Tax=Thalassotalea algicola TaxID=2716224 RepID=A0A7Y0LC18_9GAMM|nr:alpha/beta hydrolase-fold protein [Thalassotalea algicola]NMP31454.1 esterase [Thalassotalea algicola]